MSPAACYETTSGRLMGYIAGLCLGRLGRPEDISRMVEFLCEDESSYITGQVFGVNGGMEM